MSKLHSPLPRTVHLVRYGMYRALARTLARLRPAGRGYTISERSGMLPALMPGVRFEALEWPEHDLQDLRDVPDQSADVLVSDMVLEHLPDPESAFRESRRVVRPGGLVIHTTVFMMPYHPTPEDYRRFSTTELRRLAGDFRTVHDVGGFGNRRLLSAVLAKMARAPVPWPSGGPLAWSMAGNNPKFPICTWLVAEV